MQNILVTGGAGFIGSHLVRHHLNKGDALWVIDDLSTGNIENVQDYLSSLRFDQARVQDFSELQEAVKWSDRIYHMAATVGQKQVLADPAGTLSNNIQGCEALLKAMNETKKKSRLLIASTSSVYWHGLAEADGCFYEQTPFRLPSGHFLQESYGLSKFVNEVMGLSYSSQYGHHCTIARLFNTIGIGQSSHYGMVVPNFVRQALLGEPITVFGDGLQTRSFCNVHDIVHALDLLLNLPESKGEIINVGNDEEFSILDLAKMIKEKAHSSSEIRFVSYKDAYGVDFKDVTKRRPSIEKLKQITGFHPRWSLERTVEEIIDFSKNNLLEDSKLCIFKN